MLNPDYFFQKEILQESFIRHRLGLESPYQVQRLSGVLPGRPTHFLSERIQTGSEIGRKRRCKAPEHLVWEQAFERQAEFRPPSALHKRPDLGVVLEPEHRDASV